MKRQEILREIIKEDKMLVAKLLDKIEFLERKSSVQVTDFLNLYEKELIKKTLNKIKFNNFLFYGGYQDAEREILVLYSERFGEEYLKKEKENSLKVIRITLPKYIEKYTHKEYLGGIMKLGMKREKIGDILVTDRGADIITISQIAEILQTSLKELKRFSKSEIEILEIEEITKVEPEFEKQNIIVPSMRLDCFVSELVKTSRTKALEIIKQERVFINFEVVTNNSKQVKTDDIITIRGKGRFYIKEAIGNTKKDRIVIEVLKNK